PALQGSLIVDRLKVTNPVTGAFLQIMSSDAPTALGATPYRVYADELAAWTSDSLWGAIASALWKAPGARCFVLTTAGSPSSWAFRLWEHAHSSELWKVIHTSELAPWSDLAQVADAKGHLPPSLVERYVFNRWVQADEA